MAEKKTGKKFVQKPKFRNEKKYKTDKTEVKKYNTFGKKKAEKKIVVKSEKSLCPVHGKCGGCQLLDMPYEKQLKQKQKQVNKLLKPYCNTEKYSDIGRMVLGFPEFISREHILLYR